MAPVPPKKKTQNETPIATELIIQQAAR